jgi:predicted amidophosphoribosyltransferase
MEMRDLNIVSGGYVRCPSCGNRLTRIGTRCPGCGRELDPSTLRIERGSVRVTRNMARRRGLQQRLRQLWALLS